MNVEPFGQGLPNVDFALGRCLNIAAIAQGQRAIMRVDIVDCLQLGEQAVAANLCADGHCPQTDGFGHYAGFAHGGHFGLRCGALRDPDFDIAAKDRLPTP